MPKGKLVKKSRCEVANHKKDKERTCLKNTAEVFGWRTRRNVKLKRYCEYGESRAPERERNQNKPTSGLRHGCLSRSDCSHDSTLAPILSFIYPDVPPVIHSGIITVWVDGRGEPVLPFFKVSVVINTLRSSITVSRSRVVLDKYLSKTYNL